MKKFTALLLAVIMVFSLVACGGTQPGNTNKDEQVALLDYAIPQHIKADMPAEIITEEDMRMAWQYVINYLFDSGVQYNSIPVASMTKGYARQKLAKDGYTVSDWNLKEIWAEKDGHKISVLEDEENRVTDFKVQFFDLDKAGCDWNAVADVNSKVTIGNSHNIFGKTFKEMFTQLGVSDLMLAYVKLCGGQYYWYDDNNSYFGILFEEGKDAQNKYKISISLSRRENGHDQSIHLYNTEEYVSTAYYLESFYGQDGVENLAYNADVWRTKQLIMSKVWYDNGRGVIMFDANDEGQGVIPTVGTKLTDIKWENMRIETTDSGKNYVCIFKVLGEDSQWISLTMSFDKDAETITLYTSDKQVAGVFTH